MQRFRQRSAHLSDRLIQTRAFVVASDWEYLPPPWSRSSTYVARLREDLWLMSNGCLFYSILICWIFASGLIAYCSEERVHLVIPTSRPPCQSPREKWSRPNGEQRYPPCRPRTSQSSTMSYVSINLLNTGYMRTFILVNPSSPDFWSFSHLYTSLVLSPLTSDFAIKGKLTPWLRSQNSAICWSEPGS